MKFDHDPRRAAMMRDLLLDYPVRPAENAPMPPEGVADDEEALRQFYERWDMNPASQEFQQEGNYPVEGGVPDARMSPHMPFDHDMGAYLRQQMPQPSDHIEDVPMGPGGGRPHMLAQMLRRK